MKIQPSKRLTKISPASGEVDILYARIASVIHKARETVIRAIDTSMVNAYWHIGSYIVEQEQRGSKRAEYGKALLKTLSTRLTREFGRGFSVDTLEDVRKFYLVYSVEKKSDAVRRKSGIPKFSPDLSWTHYRTLMQVGRVEARKFYEIEAIKNRWGTRELERQVNSLLFDRLAKSKDKKGLLRLVNEGQEILKPEDAIKEPVILEFLGIPEAHQLSESKLEQALINNLQKFLLELGRGFAFVDRQQRLTLDGKHYYADLVFYHTVLKC
jgi:predicted nuclease of restriction endonuclease-like (RecB) superfamily